MSPPGPPPQNYAAWLPSPKAPALLVGPAPFPVPGPDQLVIGNSCVGINNIDWAKQALGDMLLSFIKHPFILGGDVAGTVVAIGSRVTRFKIGDRVVAAAANYVEAAGGNASEGGFQSYTLARSYLTAPVPDGMPLEKAVVMPLAMCTAAYGLFHPGLLGLEFPQSEEHARKGKGKIVIVTGGSSSVGGQGVQLARLAGYEVVSTASPKNFVHVKNLGASWVFDYRSERLAEEMFEAVRGKDLVGVCAIGDGSVEVGIKVLRRHELDGKKKGGIQTRKFVANAGGMPAVDDMGSYWGMAKMVGTMLWAQLRISVMGWWNGVQVRFIDTKESADPDGVSAHLFEEFLPDALKEGLYVPTPEPWIFGKGLEKIQEALDRQRKGVSRQKIVVTL